MKTSLNIRKYDNFDEASGLTWDEKAYATTN